MKEITGDYWEIAPDFGALCCTCNSVRKRDGSLVMGKGIALEFMRRFPYLPEEWGRRIKHERSITGVLITTAWISEIYLVYFQTKFHWHDHSPTPLILESMRRLGGAIELLALQNVLLPRPSCQNGGLKWPELKPVLEKEFNFDRYPYDRITFIGKQ